MTALDASATTDWLDRYGEAVAPVVPGYFDVVADRAQGSWVWDDAGTRYLDATASLWYCQVGHGRSEIDLRRHG